MSNSITVTSDDYNNICRLLDNIQNCSDELLKLEDEIDRALIVDAHEIDNNIVTMNSKVTFKFLGEEEQIQKVLVYPNQVKDNSHISILAPIGMALIGLSVGQRIDWILPNGNKKTIEILDVVFQPERNIE
ncbi:nucleoside diphosphate kinase regulator [Vibrio harveyi]|uniref:nucleoside diphosphate kinase regulator n=1 Tax=Vibrio harveyi TaxID=669 RepID=UPI000D781E60|nr:nucleoside diphosphate kinase regulator [Vibrio harveyi]WDZ73788.1 nucleoside diphosphate kinase regulator [Vibrio harveyi]GBK97551.1 nucleoside diphosphate kinase regulator [Vibrio harveyi]HDM8067348.1 nucleoside diphosphate kinase regulator [Vibrio harveyi]HDM8125938.1 nucleoside diphosphate kinase regulator [Vibrio harveyi]